MKDNIYPARVSHHLTDEQKDRAVLMMKKDRARNAVQLNWPQAAVLKKTYRPLSVKTGTAHQHIVPCDA